MSAAAVLLPMVLGNFSPAQELRRKDRPMHRSRVGFIDATKPGEARQVITLGEHRYTLEPQMTAQIVSNVGRAVG